MQPPDEILQQLPNLEDLSQRLRYHPESVFHTVGHASGEEEVAIGGPSVGLPWGPGDEEDRIRDFLSDAGARAITKVLRDGENADVDPDEAAALEAIVHLEGRPAILIQEGTFFPPPPDWADLEAARTQIENNLKSVGRIEVANHPADKAWVGTGFLVAPGVVMTNRHVAREFAEIQSLNFIPGMGVSVDFREEFGTVASAEVPISEVLDIRSFGEIDMALLKLDDSMVDPGNLPSPLRLSSAGPYAAGSRVYTVGYPAWDGQRNDPEPMRRIFSNIYNVKRLMPGVIQSVDEGAGLFMHDCSTLGGVSGSCVIDLSSHQVLGLHFKGTYLKGNTAVALWRLRNDATLTDIGASFE